MDTRSKPRPSSAADSFVERRRLRGGAAGAGDAVGAPAERELPRPRPSEPLRRERPASPDPLRDPPVWRTLAPSASLSAPVNWLVEKMSASPPMSPRSLVASSQASSPTALGRIAPSGAGSNSDRGTFTGFSPSTFSDTISRGTS